jgi:FSR family fosmidomycin resistance protein-like MFS transporter
MLGGWVTSLILFFKLRDIPGRDPNAKLGLPVRDALRAMRAFMLPLAGILFSRAFMSASITTYLPTYLNSEGADLWIAGASLSILEAAGVVGVLVGGSISDRVGRRIILLISMIATPLLAVVFLLASGVQQIVVLPFLGFFALSTTPVMMAWVQESYPENRALANGIFMAMAFVIRAVAIVILGRVGDIYGLGLGILISAVIMAAGIPLVFLLPGNKLHERA